MTTPFRLFSLPFIPLKQVLDHFGPNGIIILSLCSQRSKSIAVSYRGPSKNVQLHLIVIDNIYSLGNDFYDIWNPIDIEDAKDTLLLTLSSGQFQGVQYKMRGNCLLTFWEDKLTGLLEIGKYAREVFNQDIDQIYVRGKYEDSYKRLIEWTMDTQEYIGDFIYIEDEQTLDEDLDYILENVKCTGYLELSAKPSETYRPAKPPVFNLCKLHIQNSFWIKPEVLLGMNSQIIKLEDSKLTSQDFNVFLKHWLTGGWSYLSLVDIDVEEEINYETVFDGIEFTEEEEEVVERILEIEGEANIYSMIGGADIKRPGDNITATIKNGGENPKHFGMIVWPE